MLSKLSYCLLNDTLTFRPQNEVDDGVEWTALEFLFIATKYCTSYQVLVISLPLLKLEIS